MAFFALVQGTVFVTSATATLPTPSPIQILEKGVQGPKGAAGITTIVNMPTDLQATPPAAALTGGNGQLAYVISRQLTYQYDATSTTTADGVDVVLAAGGIGRWFSLSMVPLQPGGTAGFVLVNNGPGHNPTWQTSPGGPPSGAAGGGLSGTYPNPTVVGAPPTGPAGGSLSGTYPNPGVIGAPPIGPAGGGLTGTYPNPTVVGAPPTGIAGGGLTGTYPNPTVASIMGLAAGGSLSGTYPNPTVVGAPPIGPAGGSLAGTYPNPTVTGAPPTGPAGGSLSGTYPNPTVVGAPPIGPAGGGLAGTYPNPTVVGAPPTGAAGGFLGGTYPNPTVVSIAGIAAGGGLSGIYPNPTVVGAPPTGPAGGFLGGTYPNPTVVSIAGIAAGGSFLSGTYPNPTVISITGIAAGGGLSGTYPNPTVVGAPPTGAAGGGLTGTYPNPTVASIAGLAAGGGLSGTYPNPVVVAVSVATPATLATTPAAGNLTDGLIVYVTSRKLNYRYDATSGATVDGTDVVNSSAGGTTRWLSMPLVPLQPGGTSGFVLVNNGSGSNPTWQTPPSAPPNGPAGGFLGGTYPNPTVVSIASIAAGGNLSGTYPNPTVSSISTIVAGGDLSGNYPNPVVNKITGTTGTIAIASTAQTFQWANGTSPALSVAPSTGTTQPFQIQGQTTSTGTGGSVTLQPGGGSTAIGRVEFRNSSSVMRGYWNPNTDRFGWVAAVTTPGLGQDQSTTGAGVSMVERSQAAMASSNTSGGSFDLVLGALDGSGAAAGFNFGRETTAGSTYFAALTITPGTVVTNDLIIQKQGVSGNILVGWASAATTIAGGFNVTGQAGGTGVGGFSAITGGGAGSGGAGGAASVIGGPSAVAAQPGGNAVVQAGNSSNTGAGGASTVTGGSSTSGIGGSVPITGGTGVTGGAVVIAGGSGSTTNASVVLRPGAGAGTKAQVNIQNSAAVNKLYYDEPTDQLFLNAPIMGDLAIGAPIRFQQADVTIPTGTTPSYTLTAAQAVSPILHCTGGTALQTCTITIPGNVLGARYYVINKSSDALTFRTAATAATTPDNIGTNSAGTVIVYNNGTAAVAALF